MKAWCTMAGMKMAITLAVLFSMTFAPGLAFADNAFAAHRLLQPFHSPLRLLLRPHDGVKPAAAVPGRPVAAS